MICSDLKDTVTSFFCSVHSVFLNVCVSLGSAAMLIIMAHPLRIYMLGFTLFSAKSCYRFNFLLIVVFLCPFLGSLCSSFCVLFIYPCCFVVVFNATFLYQNRLTHLPPDRWLLYYFSAPINRALF